MFLLRPGDAGLPARGPGFSHGGYDVTAGYRVIPARRYRLDRVIPQRLDGTATLQPRLTHWAERAP
ncbi:hypothetical protein GCM10012319_17120 [Comamonas sp. KCTC 72670]|nr:hypothetical protein GCM10012319_17120 [Comamonas sp. KCTC 72670]